MEQALLDSHFTHESLAKVLNIPPTKELLVTYLGERFSLLIGPACAQRKVDAIRKAKKSFVFVDPTEPAPKVSCRILSRATLYNWSCCR